MKLNIDEAMVGGKILQVLPHTKITIKSLDYEGLGGGVGVFVLPTKLLWQMVSTCLSDDGIGLAAPQVGTFRRMFIIRDFTEEQETGKILLGETFTAYFNPSWTAIKEAGKSTDIEGCLSVPGKAYKVERWNSIVAEWWTQEDPGAPPVRITETFSGHKARVYQHETAHLNARSIVDIGIPVT